eukprot:Skav219134  [mRNA]  locus=scaffold1574:650032:650595:+ [translate_table: standard]
MARILMRFHFFSCMLCNMIQMNRAKWNEIAPNFVECASECYVDALRMVGAHSLADLTALQYSQRQPNQACVQAALEQIESELQNIIDDIAKWWGQLSVFNGLDFDMLLASIASGGYLILDECTHEYFNMVLEIVISVRTLHAARSVEASRSFGMNGHILYQPSAGSGAGENDEAVSDHGSWIVDDDE